MKTNPEHYNPLSMTEIVRRHLEKRADGAEYQNRSKLQSHTAESISIPRTSSHHKELEDTFFQMLVQSEELDTHSEFEGVESTQPEKLKENGTKSDFFSLKKGEEKKEKVDSKEFSFSIPNSSLGTLTLQGRYERGAMTVLLNLQKPLEVKERILLEKFLKFRLSKILQVPVEIKIG